MLNDEQVAEIEARANAASEGPWRWRRDYEMPDGDKHWELSNPEGDRHGKTIDASLVLLLDRDEWLHRPAETQANWEFTAHAREDVPALCQSLRAARAERDRALTPSIVEALHLLDDAGYGKEVPNALSEMIKKALAENARLQAQVIHFESPNAQGECRFCGNLRNVPHGHIQKCYCIPTIRQYREENTALREQLAQAQRRILELETEIDTKRGYL